MTDDFGKLIARVSDQELVPESREEIRQYKRRIDQQLRDLLRQGIADGSIIPIDPKLTAFAIAGALNWISVWYAPDGELSAAAIAEQYAELLTRGIAASPPE